MIWDKNESLNRNELKEIQLNKLRDTVKRVYSRVPFYKKLMDQNNISPELNSLEELSKMPFTVKEDLRNHYPYGLFAVDMKDIVRIHASSGTTGKPIVAGYTKRDLDVWADLIARIVTQAGVTREDIAQIAFSYGLFTGGFGLHYGLEKAGVTVIPASSGNTERQIMLMKDFKTTVLVCTPSYALYMAEVAQEMGVNTDELYLRLGLFGGEPCSESMRQEIEKRWNIKATVNYGLTEIIGPGVAGECSEGNGMHISEDHFIAEVIDPNTGEVLPPGSEGELVLTTLSKEALPLIRYRTRDIVVLADEPCPCGRTTARIMSIKGRTDDMMIIRGVNVFPSQIESVLSEIKEVSPHYRLVVGKQNFQDTLEVQVEPSDNFLANPYSSKQLEQKIQDRLGSVLFIKARVTLLPPKTLERTTGKSKRVIDKRVSG